MVPAPGSKLDTRLPTRGQHLTYVLTAAPGSLRVSAHETVLVDLVDLGVESVMRMHTPAPAPSVDVLEPPLPVEEWIPSDPGDVDTLEARSRRIVGFSARSRARMMYRLSTLDFTELPGVPEMITLTYGAEFPRDGAVVKAHLHAFAEAWTRRWGSRPCGVWKLEFQRRGAPHFHLYVGRPTVGWRVFLDWARATWHRIAYSCSERCDHPHLDQGVRLDRQFVSAVRSKGKIAGYFAKHNAKGTKSYQNHPPEGFENVGRFWGVWQLDTHTVEVDLTLQEWLDVRRALGKMRRARTRRKVRMPGRLIGLWSMCADGYEVAGALATMRFGPRSSFREWERMLDPVRELVPA